MNRCAYVAAKHGAFPCILAFAMAAAFLLCCPSQVASAASGSTSLVLKCTLDPENQLKVVGTLSHTAGRFSSTLKSSTEGTHEFRLQAKLAEAYQACLRQLTMPPAGASSRLRLALPSTGRPIHGGLKESLRLL